MLFHQAIYGAGFIGAIIRFEDEDKTVKNLIRYDSNTHTVTIEFEDGDILEVPDKSILIVDAEIVDIKPNQKRKNKK
jgi:hypothetical protein